MKQDLVDFLLKNLRPRPGMFLTAYNLSYLSIFLTGVEIACGELNKNGEYLERFSGDNGFLVWSWKKYNLRNRSFKLDHYLEFANADEEQALNLFFEDLEAYVSSE